VTLLASKKVLTSLADQSFLDCFQIRVNTQLNWWPQAPPAMLTSNFRISPSSPTQKGGQPGVWSRRLATKYSRTGKKSRLYFSKNTRRRLIHYDTIYLLTAIALTAGGSSTVHIYTQTIHRTTQWKQNIHYITYITIRIHKHNKIHNLQN